MLICFYDSHKICLHIQQKKDTRIFSFSFPPLSSQFPPPYFQFSHLFCSVLFFSVRNDWPAIANSSLLGDALALGSCLPKDSGITFLKTSYFAVLKAAGLSLPQKAIMQLSLSVLSPYANLMESCLQSKRGWPLSQSVIVWVHMCSHAGGVCVYKASRVSMRWFRHQTTGRVCWSHMLCETWQHLKFSIFTCRGSEAPQVIKKPQTNQKPHK